LPNDNFGKAKLSQSRHLPESQSEILAAPSSSIASCAKIQKSEWLSIARLLLVSRAIDLREEQELYPQKKVAYQFSAKGHELAQLLLGRLLTNPLDGAGVYYRSRPLMLSLGMTIEEAFSGPLGGARSLTGGRDIGVVFNLPSRGLATVLPMAGDVGAQYTPAAGWAESIKYRQSVLGEIDGARAIAVVLGGEGSVATNGFWAALNLATTANLPLLFFIEDNGFAISVPSSKQIPGGDIVENLRSFKNLRLSSGDGTNPLESAQLIGEAVAYVREQRLPALIRLRVPRLSGHSGQDTQSYKTPAELAQENLTDPLARLYSFLVPEYCSSEDWEQLRHQVELDVGIGMNSALQQPAPDPKAIYDFRYSEADKRGEADWRKELEASVGSPPKNSGPRLTMGEAIRMTLEAELKADPRVLVFGEDVGVKGGVHAVTLGLQQQFGEQRVFDTGLSEEGIIGRAVGMALSGLRPIAEIQFRKYLDPATEQMHNCGTIRWRTNGKFSAPIVVRVAGGFSRRAGDPWHSLSAETELARSMGWHVYLPSTAEDAVGLLRTAIRGGDPALFFEHRALLDAPSARGFYPGDDYCIPAGKGVVRLFGNSVTVVSWGAMIERVLLAAEGLGETIEVIDLRTICPWDSPLVLGSVRKTGRLLIVHEDSITAGFGAEIAATVAAEAFTALDAPIRRIAPKDIPIPYHPQLMNSILPSVSQIREQLQSLLAY